MFVYSLQIISRLDNQSKFQMFTPFRSHHIGVPKLYTNMAAPYWALYICAQRFDEYLKFGRRMDLKLGEVTSLIIFYNIAIS